MTKAHPPTAHDSSQKDELSFEKAFERLEKILDMLNSSHPSLEEALKLYEEADRLIIQCHKKLVFAEKKVETLIKNRQGELQLTQDGNDTKPQVTEMQLP